MSFGMPGNEEDRGFSIAQPEWPAFRDGLVELGNAVAVRLRPDHARAGRGLDPAIAADMVPVVMRVEHVCYAPAAAGRGLQYRLSLRRVERAGRARLRAMQQIGVVVSKAGDLVDGEPGHRHGR